MISTLDIATICSGGFIRKCGYWFAARKKKNVALSEMIQYPFVFDHDGERYMLYNGNGYGRTRVGLAVMTRRD
jgi:hypothetical protein